MKNFITNRFSIIIFFLLALFLGSIIAWATPVAIISGVIWPDQNGNNVQGHGGNIIKVGSTYYWFGEDKTSHVSGNTPFDNVCCYSSTDLAHWTWIRNVLQRQASGDLDANHLVERPKVIYNSGTGKYVMYFHLDTQDYSTGKVGIASCSTVDGMYTYLGSIKPMNLNSWDLNLFKDDDGTGYLLSHASDNKLHIYKLSSDYLSVVSSVAALSPNYEAPAMFKKDGRYYLFGSELTGWNSNDNKYTTATSLSGPWSSWNIFAPAGSQTWNSQVAYILPVSGSQGTTYMYMGDRWNPSQLKNTTAVWLPLQVNGISVTLPWYSSWTIDTSTGLWSGGNQPTPTPTVARTNIAINKSASADSVQSGNSATNGNDDNVATRWCANDGYTGHWWKVDLGSTYNLSGTEIYWEQSAIYKYKIDVSTNNSSWTTKVDQSANGTSAGLMNDIFTASARYVRITVTGLPSGVWASFFEFRVFSGGSNPTPTPTVTPTPTATKTATPTTAPTPTSGGYPVWAPNTAYSVGTIVTYGGRNYKCLQNHTSLVGWEPPNVPALWQQI